MKQTSRQHPLFGKGRHQIAQEPLWRQNATLTSLQTRDQVQTPDEQEQFKARVLWFPQTLPQSA